ncbi:MAG: DEAD/DEAH box helicase [Spirochaetales bacterium]|nr:DEAD/DEAH box helicase [Spirochaetales bacterium]
MAEKTAKKEHARFSKTMLKSARRILKAGRLWKFTNRLDEKDGEAGFVHPGWAGAYVLDSAPEPYLVQWNGSQFCCECPSGSPLCSHGAALILTLQKQQPGWGKEWLPDSSERVKEKSKAPKKDFQYDLFALPSEKDEEHGERPEKTESLFTPDLFGENGASHESLEVSSLTPKQKSTQKPSVSIKSSSSETKTTSSRPTETQALPQEKKVASSSVLEGPLEDSTNTENSHDGLSPQEDLLFFAAPSPVEKRAGLVLGPKEEVKKALETSSFQGLHPPSRSSQTWNLKELQGEQWCLEEAVLSLREDGSAGKPHPPHEGDPHLEWLQEEEVTSRGEDVLWTLLESEEGPWTPQGAPWQFWTGGSLHLRFDPLLSASEEEPLYEPAVELRFPNHEGATLSGAIFTCRGMVMVVDEERETLGVIHDLGESLWFLRLILSRKVMSTQDIRVRFHGSRPLPPGIHADLPQLPEALETLIPLPVLDIAERGNQTDFYPRWRYGGVFISPSYRNDVVVPPGRRAKPLGLRDRNAEEQQFRQIEEILSVDLSWKRGRYASISGDPNAPLRLKMPLSEVLTTYGKALIDAGADIRLEDKPVKMVGALSIHTHREGSVLEMSTSVRDAQGEASHLDLDEWLDRGLARTKDAYFNLTGKALEQLNYLRRNGMEDSGFLSTSPDNLSLIDAVYAQIEAAEETVEDIRRRKELYTNLTEFSPEGAPPPPPEFQASLRPYQNHGYAWLLSMRENGLGSCLADDMGLGKTVQTLAYLSRLKKDGKLGPSLLVGPVVTLGNWEAEIQRFAPNLIHRRYAGAAGKRQIPQKEEGVELLVVSYQMLRNDAALFLEHEWDHVILDEAHYVKNASSRTFKAVRSLVCQHRISLTGTPLENHLSELWSQMNFLNPGLLGTQGQFSQHYVKPVEKEGDEEAMERLSGIVAPFILRRKKSDVLHDLPPKDESVLFCDMTEAQRGAYNAMRALYQNQVAGLLSKSGLKTARLEIFTILSKLRLLAIHPPLAGRQFADVPSGKMRMMDNLLEEVLEEDHKTLVFSQFLGALDRIESTCHQQNWNFSRLTGSTKDREEQIRRFREEEDNRIFLLSLRAGGVGINLTAADYVILLDPWWNPAVEAQAIDRAHRMGQQRPVMAYRLITKGTIEEKVLELQQRKKDLIAGVLGDGAAPDLTEDEIMDLFEHDETHL